MTALRRDMNSYGRELYFVRIMNCLFLSLGVSFHLPTVDKGNNYHHDHESCGSWADR